jgi:NADP-dependent 3-hydroxy acid dehydrogenase YdfG
MAVRKTKVGRAMGTVPPNGPLGGKTAVVTGASRGIGLECARALHGAGARVVLVARGAKVLKTIAAELGDRAHPIVGDMVDTAAVQRVIGEIRALLKGVPDILVNNAGRFGLAAVELTSVVEFANTLQVNLTSQFAFLRDFLPDLRERGSGHIITIGSIADRHAFAENAAYATSKFGVRGLHEVLREEVRGSGVRATLISPGPVDTQLWDEVDPDAREGFTPRKEMLDATAVAEAVLFAATRPAAVNIDELRLSRS